MIFRFRSPRALIGGLLLVPVVLSANPTGGTVAAGSATIAGQGTSAVTIHQASNTAIINWQSFSINSGESTSFLQPGANSAALNRVLGGGTSLINGTLSANGQVYLINGNGVIVGPGGVVNANAFTASTRDITNADFLSGNLHFTGSSEAGVQNLGSITALGGNVALIGRTVDNEGTIIAPKGTAGLIAANDVLLAQNNADGSTITVSPATVAPVIASGKVGVKNGGVITAAAAELKAANGNIYGLAVQNLGTIRATTVSHQGGHIWLTSDSGKVSNAGTLDASATAAGGKGGTIAVKSTTGAVSHTGQIIAKGGPGGVGGNAEISGAQVQFTGKVDLTAPHGTMGNLLIDPSDIDVVTGGGTDITASTVDPSAIVSALNGANVTLTATNSITVDDTIDSSSNPSPGNLILDSTTLILNAPIVLNGSLSGTAPQVTVGSGGTVQNAIDAVAGSGTIGLANGATYSLSTELVINRTVDLEGNGASLDGGGSTRIMEVDGGTVTLNNLIFQGGNGVSTGGASAGAANGDGGALLLFGEGGRTPSVSITNSTFVGNSAPLNGGAIFNDGNSGGSASVTAENSTFVGNSANNGSVFFDVAGSGSSATIALKVDTIAMNSGNGAIYASASGGTASIFINDTILAGNTNGTIESDFVNAGGATMNDAGYNLFGQNNNAGGFVPTGTGDVLLFDGITDELGPLGLFGGFTPTLPLLETSLAFESGDPAFTNAADQRGIIRGSPANFTGSNTDIGAFEAQVVSLQADPVSVVYGNSPTLTYTVTSGTAASVSTLAGSPALLSPATNVGTYGEDIGQGTVTAAPGYIVDFTDGDLTITPRSVVILPDSGQTKVYGSPDPVLTYSANGLINGDTLTGSPSYVGAGATTGVGNYQTTLGTVADPTGNYSVGFSAVAPTFAITPATLYYVADPVTVPLNSTEFPNFTGTVGGFVPGDTEANSTTGSIFFTTAASPSAPQGYYEIDGGGLSAANYTFAQAAVNTAALQIGNPAPRGTMAGGTPNNPTTPAETQTAASTPNTPTSQAIAQTTPGSGDPSDGTTATITSGGNSQPQTQGGSSTPVDMNVTSISPNESIDSTSAVSGGGGGGDATSSGGTDTTAVAQSSSFNPDIGATAVTPGQSITVGGKSGAPPPPVVQAQLNQILGTGALDTLSTALSSATTASTDDSSSSTSTSSSSTASPDSSTSSTPGTSGQTATAAAAAAAASSPNAYANGPIIVGPSAMIAPGQTVTLGGGRASAGPPPVFVQTAFNQGFSPDSRDSLAKAAGL